MHAKYAVLALALLCIATMAPAQAKYVEEFSVAPINWNHAAPSISGDTVVWTDFINGHDAGMYGTYLGDDTVFTVWDEYGPNESIGVVDGHLVVWQRGAVPSSFDIYGKNLLTGITFPIANTGNAEMDPDISGTMVVCEVLNVTYDIYAYDLSKFPYAPLVVCNEGTTHQQNPAIHGDLVVWEDYRNGNGDIYGAFFVDGMPQPPFPLCTHEAGQTLPAVHEDIVVWVDTRNGTSDIYGYNVSTGREFAVAVAPGTQTNPAVHGPYAVYESNETGAWNIYGCDLRTGQTFPITNDAAIQGKPDIYGNTAIWYDLSAPQRFINGAVIHDNNGSAPASAHPLVTTHLARALSLWDSLVEELPAELTDEQMATLDDVQALMEKAVSVANPLYAAGMLRQAIDIMTEMP